MRCSVRRAACLGALALTVSACSDSPTGPRTGMSELTLSLGRLGGAPQAAAGLFGSAIDLGFVDELVVTVTRVEFLPAGGDEENRGGWVSLDVDDVTLDLMALPTDPADAVILATGELPAGAYGMLRLFVSDATILFNTPVQLGQAFTYEAGTPYTVFIPSGDQTGIKTDQGFTLAEGAVEVGLLFDEHATLANVTGTGNGMVIMAPVLRVAAEE